MHALLLCGVLRKGMFETKKSTFGVISLFVYSHSDQPRLSEVYQMINLFGYLYAIVGAAYFILSGFLALRDIPAKMERIGLQAVNTDGQTAFVIIYVGLMAGTGFAALFLMSLSKKWLHPTVLVTTMVGAILVFRIWGNTMTGEFSTYQLTYLFSEIAMVLPGIFLTRYGWNK